MYEYKCSKNDCGRTWTVEEGCLNGFTLTCPVCGKGRGLFQGQVKSGAGTEKKDQNEKQSRK